MDVSRLTATICQYLPKELQDEASDLAKLIEAWTKGDVSERIASDRILGRSETLSALKLLSGKCITTEEIALSFGKGNQFGDISIRDVAGRDVVNLVIVFSPNGVFPREMPGQEVDFEAYLLTLRPRTLRVLDKDFFRDHFSNIRNRIGNVLLYMRGRELFEQRHYFESAFYWDELNKRFPGSGEYSAYLRLCIGKIQREEDVSQSIFSLLCMAMSLINMMENKKAMEYIEKALVLDPSDEEALCLLEQAKYRVEQ